MLGCGSNQPAPPPEPGAADLNFFAEPKTFQQIVDKAEANADNEQDSTALLKEFGHHWLYGNGIGQTMANVGTVVVFPPYALYLLGNAGLVLAGYDPLYVTSALPDGARDVTLSVYNGITSVPGHVAATVAGEDFSK